MIWASLGEQGISPTDRGTWTRPLVRRTRRAGVGGTVPVRFPSEEYPGEVGYHIEGT